MVLCNTGPASEGQTCRNPWAMHTCPGGSGAWAEVPMPPALHVQVWGQRMTRACLHSFVKGEKGTHPDQLRCVGDESTAVPVTAPLSTYEERCPSAGPPIKLVHHVNYALEEDL